MDKSHKPVFGIHTMAKKKRMGAAGMKIGMITRPSAWLYDERKQTVTDEVFMGWAVGILSEKEGWLEAVTHYGYRGYLKRDSLRSSSPEELHQRDQSGETACLKGLLIDVMEEAGVRSRVLATLSRGSFFQVLPEVKNGYRRIALAGGQEGYLPCISYERRKDTDGYLYEKEPEAYFIRQVKACRHFHKNFRKQLAENAMAYLNAQYRWGGKSAAGLDCSGLTFMSYLMSGILIYRDARIWPGYPIHKIPFAKARMGDLLYFPGHIAMYLGNGNYIHATGNRKNFGCAINSLSPKDSNYREDLADALLMAGSIF